MTSTSHQVTWTCASTCGNICYADATTLGSSVIISSSVSNVATSIVFPFTKPKPTCVVPADVCASMTSAYTSSSVAYVNSVRAWSASGMVPPVWPYCNGERPRCELSGIGKARLFYWPVPETVSRDMCFSGGTAKTQGWIFSAPNPLGDAPSVFSAKGMSVPTAN